VSSYAGRTPDGDPAYLAGALDRAEKGQPLRPIDVQELGYLIGRRDARRVARDVEAYARARKTWAGLHQRALPFPDALARLFARLRSREPLGPDDARRFVAKVGRRELRRLSRTVTRTTASRARAQGRHTYTRRGRRRA
jgi:hypothetical protein